MSTEAPCDELSLTPYGKAPLVTDEFGCQVELIQSDLNDYPAIQLVKSDDEVVLADGSVDHPFELPNLQQQTGGSFTRMMVQDSAGKWYIFRPPNTCIKQRLLIIDGSFTFEDDVLSDLILSDICEISSCDEYDYLIGVKQYTEVCTSGNRTFLKPVLVPKTLCPTCEE